MFLQSIYIVASRISLLFLLVVLTALSTACKSENLAAAKQQEGRIAVPKKVKTARVAELPVARAINVTGTLAAYDQATLSVKVPGRLSSISVDLGSVVHQGQLIAQIDPQDYQLRLQQAEAALAQARARLGLSPNGTDELADPKQASVVRQAQAVLEDAESKRERTNALLKQGIISQAEYDTAETAYKVALSRYQDAIEEVHNRQALLAQRRSELALARQQVADTAIYASFDGIVQEKRASLGEYLAASAPIVTIVRMSPLRLRAEVPERDATSVRAGQRVEVTIEGDTKVYTGRIERLSPTIAEQNRMLMVEAEIPNNGNLRPGSFARADIVVEEQKMVMAVPSLAVVTFAGIEKVITVQDGKAVEKAVTTGRRLADNTEIVYGLSTGTEVVVEPGNLQSGQPVEVMK
ncbi:MAG: efflux RND transporter periplasmic adaptor subunit [Acidobacteriota bacterium]